MDMLNVFIDKRIKKFVKGYLFEKNFIGIHLEDIDETFYFDNELSAQNFLNKQVIERVGDKELRTDYFDYVDEYGVVHRYLISKVFKGEIIFYIEDVINKLSEKELYEEYGYLMDEEHGHDTELLIDIMKCNGIRVENIDGFYVVTE